MVEKKNPVADKSNHGVTTNQPKNYLYCFLELLLLVPELLLLYLVLPELLFTLAVVLRATDFCGVLFLLTTVLFELPEV